MKAGKNSAGKLDYHGPCPPSGIHRYFFKLYALDVMLDQPEGISKEDLLKAMEGHILSQGELIGRYQK
jgi:Raf kinase inhibitor-like YbhB/YbcL family protein